MEGLSLKENHIGKGVFANKNFARSDFIIEFEGEIIKREAMPLSFADIKDYYIQVGRDIFIGPSGKIDDYFNHSCEPNSGVKIGGGRAFLVAIKKINKGEEITFDYSTTMYNDGFVMDCLCGSKLCRGKISEFKNLPYKVKMKYKKFKIVPDYVIV